MDSQLYVERIAPNSSFRSSSPLPPDAIVEVTYGGFLKTLASDISSNKVEAIVTAFA